MKTKVIAGLAALAVAAFPISALAARTAAAEFVCPVEGCDLAGEHAHCTEHENCTVVYSDGCCIHSCVQASRSSCHRGNGGHGCHGGAHH